MTKMSKLKLYFVLQGKPTKVHHKRRLPAHESTWSYKAVTAAYSRAGVPAASAEVAVGDPRHPT